MNKGSQIICLLCVLSSTVLLAQKQHTFYVGSQKAISATKFTSLGYIYSTTKQHQFEFSVSFSKSKTEGFPFAEKNATYYSHSSNPKDIIYNTQPNMQTYNLGYRRNLTNNKHVNLYVNPELSIVHVGSYLSYLRKQQPTGNSTSGGTGLLFFDLLFWGAPSYEVAATTYSSRVSASDNAYLNCKVGVDARYHNIVLDLYCGVGGKFAGNTQTSWKGKENTGFQLNNYNFLLGTSIGFEF